MVMVYTLEVSLSLLTARFAAASDQGCTAYSISMLCSPPEQANAFFPFPVKRVECCGSANFLDLQIATKGSAAVTLQQCSTYQTGNDFRNMFIISA